MSDSGSKILDAFSGATGRARIEAILVDGRVLRGLGTVASALAACGTVEQLDVGRLLCEQGSIADDVFFILSGRVDVLVNGQPVAQRAAGDLVGEMALLEPSPVRSASVVAREPTCVLHVTSEAFNQCVGSSAPVWRGIARELASRLRQRSQFVPKANSKPRMFIGSSVEKLRVVDAFLVELEHTVDVKPWTGAFRPSRYTVDELTAALQVCDFAMFVFAPDDVTSARGATQPSVRDNVVFEAGLFMGVLGYERVFLAKPRGQDLRLPSDLVGLTPVDYAIDAGVPNVAAACARIREVVRALGCRVMKPALVNP